MMTLKQFKKTIKELKLFMDEQEKLNDVIKVISPSSTGVVEFGNRFIDKYIDVIEIALFGTNSSDWVSWFVFENDFGKNELNVKINNRTFTITDEESFYYTLTF